MFLPVPADTSPPPECMAAGTWGRDVETKQRDCDCVRATVWRKEKKKKVRWVWGSEGKRKSYFGQRRFG